TDVRSVYSIEDKNYFAQSDKKAEAWGKDYLAKVAQNLKKDGITAKSVVLIGKPAEEILDYVAKNAIDLIVMQEQLIDGQRKITHLTEVDGMEHDEVILKDLFSYEIQGVSEADKSVIGRWKTGGVVPGFFPRFRLHGIDLPQEIFNAEQAP
ncbi:MAG: universal stress protein, partial [Candidatus Omnitrophota bacterium]